MRKWNKTFDVESIQNTNFKLVLVDSTCDNNIEDCLTNNNLRYPSSNKLEQNCHINYVEDNFYNSKLVLDGDVTFNFEGAFDLKGVFITTSTGYVMGYAIISNGFNVSNQMIFEDGLNLWTITEGILDE